MKAVLKEKLKKRMGDMHPRTRRTQLNAVGSVIIRGSGMLISLALVPLTIDYLSPTTFGTWLTISSIVTMMAFFDVGIGNGLRNKFAEAISRQDTQLARSYLSTAYALFGLLQVGLIGVFLLVYYYVPWQRVLNTSIDATTLRTVVLITVLGMALRLVLDMLSAVLHASQRSGAASMLALIPNVVILLGTYWLTQRTQSDLIALAALTAFAPVLVLLVASLAGYGAPLRAYRPALSLVDFRHARSLLSLGSQFFLIQIAALVLFYCDNLIITQLFGPAEVTTYNVAYRYFNALITFFAIAMMPYWSAFTEAYTKNDTVWMQQTYRQMRRVWVLLVGVVIVMILMSDQVYALWMGDRVSVPFQLSMCMGLFVIVTAWNNAAAIVINGVGKIRLQLYLSVLSAMINIPLALFLGRTMEMGTAGVIMATCISLLSGSIFGYIQANRLVMGRAKGVWNK